MLAKGLTAADLRSRTWPAPVQLVDGAVVIDSPGNAHQLVVDNIFAKLVTFTGGQPGRGEVGLVVEVTLNAANVYVPDVWWARTGRADAAAGRLDAVPDLAVEVRSPATWRYDSGPKRLRYGEAGTAELWLVDHQARRITVHRRPTADAPGFGAPFTVTTGELLVTPLLPGFSLDLEEVFRPER